MSERAHLAHQLEGRARLAIPARRGDVAYFSMLSQQLANAGAVHSVRANPVTGSVLLEFSGTLDDVVHDLEGGAALEVERPSAAAPLAASPVAEQAEQAPPWRLVSGRELNHMHMAGALFSVVGMVQIVRGRVMMPALAAFWCAVHAFREANRADNRRFATSEAPLPNGGSDD